MGGSHKNLLDIVFYGRDLYCKSNPSAINRWPQSYTACMQVLRKAGYTDPLLYYVCFDQSHQNQWSMSRDPEQCCQYCHKPGNIKYYYLSIADKMKRWCSSETFCHKMTSHWEHRDRWLNRAYSHTTPHHEFCEIWDGDRFSQLAWFWDPTKQWLLPTRCNFCNEVISAEDIAVLAGCTSTSETRSVTVHCSHCHTEFPYLLKYAHGDPRNVALLGHWDGWQPFSTSIKHSCGMILV